MISKASDSGGDKGKKTKKKTAAKEDKTAVFRPN